MKQIEKHYIYVLFCILLPILLLLPLIVGHTLYYGNDMSFHVSRFYEVAQNIKHGSWFPYINTYSFNHAGVPLNLMYGILLIYPIAFAMLITNNYIVGIYLGIAFIIGLSMVISYICYYKYSNNNRKSILFASLYNISIYSFGLFIDGFNFGEATGTLFLPIIAYGIYTVCENEKHNYGWVYLAVGLSLTLYNHILSFLMFFGFAVLTIIIGLLFSKKSNRSIIIECFKSFSLGTSLSMFFICGFVSIYFHNNMRLADHGSIFGINPVDLLIDTINNRYYIGALLFTLLIIVLVHWYDLKKENKISIILTLVIVYLMTSYANFIWKLINHTPLTLLQWTGRLTVIVQFLVSLVVCDYVYRRWNLNNIWRYVSFLAVIIIFFMGNFINWQTRVNSYQNINQINTTHVRFPANNFKISKNSVLKSMVEGHYTGVGSLDYLKVSSYKEAKLLQNTNSNFHDKIQSIPNGVVIHYNSNKKAILNTSFYDYTNYDVRNNMTNVKTRESKRGTLMVPIQKGSNKIVIKYRKPAIVWIGQIISIVGLLSIICILLLKNFKSVNEIIILRKC